MKHKIAIVEDNHEIRTGLMMIINSTGNLECNHIFANAEDAIKLLPLNCADVVLMDIDLPGMNGIEAIKILKKSCSQSQFMIISVFEDEEKIFKSLEAGANGYLLKKTVAGELVSAIQDIMNGGSPMNAQIARRVVASFRVKPKDMNGAGEDLSKRERELVELLAKGFRYKEIAEKLFISQDTVRTHIRNIYQKLQVNSKVEAINKVFK
ncbi:MAG: response regulator transcription factor [Bacteroidia bacterium]|nr:response regulator transcription factor [Bacteroidia bacterium]